jgi:hypothetical protein
MKFEARNHTRISLLIISIIAAVSCNSSLSDKLHGPLRVSHINPRYFTDDLGKAVLLTGSHTWNNLVDMSPSDPPEEFDFVEYVDWLKLHNHNFIRLWTWELVNWDTEGNNELESKRHFVAPHPWARTGPGIAIDGKPKFDLTRFDREYFKRLRKRVKLAAQEGIYVSVMLFEGWGMQFSPNAFENHPFHPENNINSINGDANGDGSGLEIHTLENEEINTLQKEYISEVVKTVNKFDNVLFEISNENHPASTGWQYAMITFIKEHEKKLKKQHPVGMTFQYRGGSNETLFNSPAEWVSPNPDGGYRDDPPPTDGSRVVITDTDHLWGIGGNQAWVWKSLLRGLNPIFMDPYDCSVLTGSYDPGWVEPLRRSLGYARSFSERINLINMIPRTDIASSGYCLANDGKEYLIYIPERKEVTLNFQDIDGIFHVEWLNPENGETRNSGQVSGGKQIVISSPFEIQHAVLHLKLILAE